MKVSEISLFPSSCHPRNVYSSRDRDGRVIVFLSIASFNISLTVTEGRDAKGAETLTENAGWVKDMTPSSPSSIKEYSALDKSREKDGIRI